MSDLAPDVLAALAEPSPPITPPGPRLTRAEVAERGWLSFPEVGQFLGVTTSSVYRWHTDGLLPSVKVGGRYRVSTKVLLAWIDGEL